ncbi:putative bifunctional diguanylate cyclase/phosphodiesterase [Sulfurirhabdus autotrophica]|uniref:PAS domain S-box-containing protein/diguanylate cyclase (GGDEF)-like protein n=1 Tax=Sulfurirhabdus autotrophica TaxID=1706046 RepID=A0A4R3XWG6_9PROT|nr:EAL domain-containing protein [Sulfurirhabdus autotrophica]TCV81240.1 PAS domain S-box-containing protein/diguanylate cyclase (GGDEF)-like protein [Sulfurirhabdus autotrophica]
MQTDSTTLIKLINWLAGTVAIFIAAAVPASYLFISYQYVGAELQTKANYTAIQITALINKTPATWIREEQKLTALLSSIPETEKTPESSFITDIHGKTIASSPTNWPATVTISRSAAFYDSGLEIGNVTLIRSLLPLFTTTALFGLAGITLGLIIFIALRVLPIRALNSAVNAMRQKEKRLQVVLENAADGILSVALDGLIESSNPAAEKIFGLPQITGMNFSELVPDPHATRLTNQLTQRGKSESIGKHADGSSFPIELDISEAMMDKRLTLIVIVRDISERKEAEQKLSFLANFDSLTGLPNRSLFRDRLAQAVARADRQEHLVALLFLDLDRFKTINDSLGHTSGDHLLLQVAHRLKSVLRKCDTVARLGGDEFTLILEDISHIDVVSGLANKILDIFAEPFVLDNQEFYISTSIGITLYPFDETDIDNLIKDADTAMYHAKAMGRNNYQFYTQEINKKDNDRLTLETDLRKALDRDEFQLHFQPKINLKNGKVVGVEALLRWKNHPNVSPAAYIPLLEETGLIIPVGEWVLRTACNQIRAWQAEKLPALHIAVNLSVRQFSQKDLIDTISRILNETGLEPYLLELEITESLLMDNKESNIAILTNIKNMGVRISMDDFGTGYSSLSYLKRFPIHTLKIDQSFVKGITTNADDAAIAGAIINLAHSLRLNVVAEGVETQEQHDFLLQNDCNQAQGYLISRPLPAAEFETWLKARNA